MLTSKQENFIQNYIQFGDAKRSAILAGYPERSAKAKGSQLKKQFQQEIKARTELKMMDGAQMALDTLLKLAEQSTSDTVKLAAAKDILDRSGYQAVQRVEQTHIEQSSTAELERELKVLLGEEEKPEVPVTLN
jgi:phage terminase small subunit